MPNFPFRTSNFRLWAKGAESGSGHPALAGPALSRGLGLDGLQSSLPALSCCSNSPFPPHLNHRLPPRCSLPRCLLPRMSLATEGSGDTVGVTTVPCPGPALGCSSLGPASPSCCLAGPCNGLVPLGRGGIATRLCSHYPKQWVFSIEKWLVWMAFCVSEESLFFQAYVIGWRYGRHWGSSTGPSQKPCWAAPK